MGALIREANEVTKAWLEDITSEDIIALANGLAILMLASAKEDDEEISEALKSFATLLRELKTNELGVLKDADILAKAIDKELEANWCKSPSNHEHVALMM